MNIIICGAGRVGYTIAKLLSEQDHSITVIDQSSEDIQKINDDLDVKSIVGKATYPSVLEKANAEDEVDVISRVITSEVSCIPKPKDYELNYFSLPNIIQWGFIPLFTKR